MSMYSSRGGQQQPYASQSAAYSQNLMPAYAGSSVGGPDGSSQLSMASRHSSMLGGPQESDITGYRGHPSAGAHYGGQYSSVYGSAALSSGQQVSGMSAKGAGPSALEGRSGYGSAMPDSPKLPTGDFVSSSSHGYGHKSEKLFSDKISDYSSADRRQYAERQSAYVGRDLQTVPTGRFGDSMSFAHQHQTDMYDRMDQASLLRQEQLLKAQSLQSASLDGGSRQADYLAARGASIRHPAQDHMSFGGRMDADPRSLSILSGSSYGGQHTPSILGAAPQRNVDDLIYAQSSSNPGYGVSLPPGRDYATGKGLHGASLDSDYPGSLLARGGHSRIDERNDDRGVYARELERREEERRREHLRDREKDREREKERERERRRERERERENILARREKERDRERERGAEIRRERGAEIRRERTPPRISKSKDRSERRGSSLTKDAKPARRDPPRTEALHRRHSPVKEKRREYDCKVYSSSLVDVERDYLSLDKRYPRLFISPECSKVVVNWPRESLRLSIHTPVSFEHDFVEEDTGADQKERPAIPSADEPVKSERGTTVWNAKVILMSGLSQNALDELSSENSYDDRIPHFCNMLRFAVLKKEHSLMAIGGPWDIVDGGDPSVDDSSLVRTVVRHAKDVTQLDLKNCRHWNRFLEIHYEKVGNDGLFSHKEVTVLYVPDLSDCLPSLEAWRDQWLAHKKAVAERESRLVFKKEKSREKLEGPKGKETDSSKEVKGDDKSEKKVESAIPGQVVDVIKKQKDDHKLKGNSADKAEVGNEKSEKKVAVTMGEEGNNVENKELGEDAVAKTAVSGKLGKRKVVKRVIRQKVAAKKDGSDNLTKQNDGLDNQTKQNENLEVKNVGEKSANPEITGQPDESSANASRVKTFTRKKVVKKVPVVKAVLKKNEGMDAEMKADKEPDCSEDKPEVKSDSSNVAVVQDAAVKTTTKKKVVKRVPKRKVTGAEANEGVSDSKKDDDKDGKKVGQAGNEAKNLGDQTAAADSHVDDAKLEKKVTRKMSESVTPVKQDDVGNSSKSGSKADKEDKTNEKRVDEKSGSVSKINNETGKQKPKDNHISKREKSKEIEKSKDEEKKNKEGKDESKSKSNKDVKEKKQPEEPPRHPGLFLQTKASRGFKLRSLSLSLDSLLDYTAKDIEESTFELSLFAESLYEMLQYQMGSRLLTFLQKLRIKYVMKRNQRKRQREENAKENDEKSSTKRVKTDEATVEAKTTKTEAQDAPQHDEKSVVKEENTSVDGVENVKEEDDEDPEEDPEEDDDMPDANPQQDLWNEESAVEGKTDDADINSEKVTENAKDKEQETGDETSDNKPVSGSESKPVSGSESKENVEKTEKKKKETPLVVVDKELLQAFRFFDRNRVGYIRVEDMRLIIHNLGKFLSYRDVKELVQSALLESSTGRDDRILYNKLVRMADI